MRRSLTKIRTERKWTVLKMMKEVMSSQLTSCPLSVWRIVMGTEANLVSMLSRTVKAASGEIDRNWASLCHSPQRIHSS